MLRLDRVVKPWMESGALNAHINLYGFWNDEVFITKSGDLGIVLRVRGVDYESLDQAAQEYAVKRLEAALKMFGPGFHVYQYLFKTNRPHIPFESYDDPIVQAAVNQRKDFFESKLESLFEVEIFYAIVLEGTRSKTGVTAALKQLASDPMAGLRELKAQFSNDKMKVLLREHIEADLLRLEQRVNSFMRQLADFLPIDALQRDDCFRFFRRLVNYDLWRIEGRPVSGQFLDYQVVNSDIEAERDHLRVGNHFLRVLTMKEAIGETKPLVLKQLLEVQANFCIVTEWVPLDTALARKEITKRKRHFNITKTSFITSMQRDPAAYDPRNTLMDESNQADIENLGDCLRALGEGQSLGEFSLTVVLYGEDKRTLDRALPEVVRVFTSADGNLFSESYNQLNAYFAIIPGNYRHNLRRLFLLNTNYADLSFLFTILPGEKRNDHLGTEYLAVLETDHATPYFLNLHNRDVAHTLILGATGAGKSFLANSLLQNAQKYRPLTYIFDIGGSFESLTRIFSGSYLNVGHESRDFTINPFSLEPNRDNLQFLYSLFRVLIERDRYKLDFKEERQLYSAIERIYVLEPEQRTLSNLAEIVGELKERLHRWTRAGQYGFLFDNANDTLTFSPFQTFNFHGWSDTPELLEPLLFYVLHRASNEITDPKRLGTFKIFLLDEAWLFIRNETIRAYITQAQKTWRKHNAAMILATQSIKELAASGMLTVVAESCGTKIFLANPDMEPAVYRDAFGLNDTEIALISELVPPSQMLIRKHEGSKKVHLNVDSLSYWMATNNARDNVLKYQYLDQYGPTEGLRRLAEEHPFDPGNRSRPRSSADPVSAPIQLPLEGVAKMKLAALLPILLTWAALVTPGHAETAAHTIAYHSQDIVNIRAKVKYTTLIQLPSTEKIIEAATGDKEFWIIDVVGSFCFVHPAKPGIRSNLNLITDKGNIYSFTLEDVSNENADPDLKVIVQPADRSSIAASTGPAQFVPVSQVTAVQDQLQALQSRIVQTIDQYKDSYRGQLKFDYHYKQNEAPFNIASIFHDDRFTYIKSDAQEKFTLYEVRDGAPNLINYDLKDGTYVIPKILDRGYVEIGKKRMEFERKQGQ